MKSLRQESLQVVGVSIAAVSGLALVASYLLIRISAASLADAELRNVATQFSGQFFVGSDRRLSMSEEPDDRLSSDSWFWQVSENGQILARSPNLAREALSPLKEPHVVVEQIILETTVRAVSVPLAEDVALTVARTSEPTTVQALYDWLPIAAVISLIGLMTAGVVGWQVSRVLAGFRILEDALLELKSGRTRRLSPAPFTELLKAEQTINALLGDQEESHRILREDAARLAHTLKTPLAVLAMRFSDEEAASGSGLEPMVRDMQRSIDRYLQASRAGQRSAAIRENTDLLVVVRELALALHKKHRTPWVPVLATDGEVFTVGASSSAVMEMVGNVIENAIQHGSGTVSMMIKSSVSGAVFSVRNGLKEAIVNDLDELVGGSGGLGLDMTREIAARHGIGFSVSIEACEFIARLEFPAVPDQEDQLRRIHT